MSVKLVFKSREGGYFGVWLGRKVVATSLFQNFEEVCGKPDSAYFIELCAFGGEVEDVLRDLLRMNKLVKYKYEDN